VVPFVTGDATEDFWKQNPELKTLSPFDEIVKKKYSSRAMWSIFMIKDPASIYNRYSETERIKKIEDNYIRGDFTLKTFKKQLEAYPIACLSISKKAYLTWVKEVESFSDYYEKLPYNADNIKVKQAMLKDKDKIWDSLKKAEQEANEEYMYKVEGNRMESLLELEEL
jgi:hypothetical protein